MIRSPRSAPAAANSRTTRHLPTPRRTAYPPCSAADPRGSPAVTSSCRPSCPGRRLGPTRAGRTIRPRRRAARAVSNSESSPAATATTRWRGPRPFCCPPWGLRGDPSAYVAVSAFAPPCILCASGWRSSWSHQSSSRFGARSRGTMPRPLYGGWNGEGGGGAAAARAMASSWSSPDTSASRTMTSTVVTFRGRIDGSRFADA